MTLFGGSEHKSLAEYQAEEELLKQRTANVRQKVSLEKQRYYLRKLKQAGGEVSWFTKEHGVDFPALIGYVKGFFKSNDDD